ncbi:hypothetical protein D3C76_882660 [compost metagenome]
MFDAWFVVAGLVAGLHARIEAVASGILVTADQYRALQQGHVHLIVVLPHIELGTRDPDLAIGSLDHERVFDPMADLEERLALVQDDPALVLVVAVGQLCTQVELYLAAIGQGYLLALARGFEVLVGVGYPAQVPASKPGKRNRQQAERCRNAVGAPGSPRRRHGH